MSSPVRDQGSAFSVRKVALPSRLKATDFVADVVNATMVQFVGKVALYSMDPLVRLPNTEPEVVFTSWKPVMAMAACDWAWSKMDTNTINNEKQAAIFMVLKLAKTRTIAPGGLWGLVDCESVRRGKL